MRIAQIAPLEEAVPPKLYGGTERVVAHLTDALVDLGHEVTLFASGDSETKARLMPSWPRALRLDPSIRDPHVAMHLHLESMAGMAAEFDLIHSHIDYYGFSLLRRLPVPTVTTLHGRLDLPELQPLYDLYDDVNLVSISESQRLPLPRTTFTSTVPHGLPENLLVRGDGSGAYLAFLGRMSADKGPDAAIRIANAAAMPLKMAAKIGSGDREFYGRVVAPLLDRGAAEFIGEIREGEKQMFLGQAAALLFPIVWPEPFGLVMIEAMACGTPVIAFDNGSVREILEDGVTGFIVRNEAEAVAALGRLGTLSRDRIRAEFVRRFTARHMAQNYVKVYQRLCRGARSEESVHVAPRAPVVDTVPGLFEPAFA